ncbi:hypothetical protein ACPA9J_27830 [Pseudomonas aeruginosa]
MPAAAAERVRRGGAAALPARLDARGAVQERIEASLAELARRRQGLPVALFLHPRDCRLVNLELPALPAASSPPR